MKFNSDLWGDESRSVDLDPLVRGFASVVAAELAKRLTDANVMFGGMDAKRDRHEGPRLMLTVEEAARRLAVGRTVVYGLIKTGELESVVIGRSRRVPTEALDKYVRTLRGHSN